MTAYFYTLGCKVNQYESMAMAQLLERNGHTVTDNADEADLFIINSCTVTAESDRKTRQAVRRFKQKNPGGIVVLTGCMPQAVPESGEKLEEADIVLGNRNNSQLCELIEKHKAGERTIALVPHKRDDKFDCLCISDFYGRTRAEVKIEDGCNRYCSYCLIPYARGFVRSKPLDVIKEECLTLSKKGFREIVIVGINLSAYGTENAEGKTIVDAVKAVSEIDGILRIRLGSLEPDHITDKVIEGLSEIEKFCPQFHISLQSGCNKTLKAMNRHYSAEEYFELCQKLRGTFADCTLTTDVMVGFPGETDEDFIESLDFVKKVGFEKVHVFPYSRRPGTPADKMPCQLTSNKKAERASIMSEAAAKIRLEFLKKQIGKTVSVLPEEYHDNAVMGYTANYIPVLIEGNAVPGEPTDVTVKGVTQAKDGSFMCTASL